MSQSNRPVHEITHFPVRVSIWENESEEGRTFYSTTVTRLYKQKGKWKSTASLNAEDLLVAAKALDAADTWIREQQQTARDDRREREAVAAGSDF
jgi:hypothetical protein